MHYVIVLGIKNVGVLAILAQDSLDRHFGSELHDLQTFYTCEIPFHGRAHSGVRGEHCPPARPRFEPDQGFAGNVFLPMAELDASGMPAFTCAACSLTEWEGRCEEQCQKYEQEKEG